MAFSDPVKYVRLNITDEEKYDTAIQQGND